MKINNSQNGIHVVDQETDMRHVIRDIAEIREEAFYVFDIADMIQKHSDWKRKMPRVTPYYAVKCNDNEWVLKILAAMGLGFDCASKYELKRILELGVKTDRIIFANPAKLASHIRYAASVDAQTMTFDSEQELYKIKMLYPSAKLLLRIRADARKVQCALGIKYGCDSITEAPKLLRLAQVLKLNIIGISFHVGSGCEEPIAYKRAIGAAYNLFKFGLELDFDMTVLDIGGGFPGNKNTSIDPIAEVVNEALEEYFPVESGIQVIAEPGRYYVASAFTLVTCIHSKREVIDPESQQPNIMYFIDDGIYGSFNSIFYDHMHPVAVPLNEHTGNILRCSIWGPTCDGLDVVVEDTILPDLNIGDWILFENMGAYTIASASNFNGFHVPVMYNIINESAMLFLKELRIPEQFIIEDIPRALKRTGFENSNLRSIWLNESGDSNKQLVISDLFKEIQQQKLST